MAAGARPPRGPTPAPTAIDRALPGLLGTRAADRFRAWAGRSGRRYVCSVFAPGTDPADLPLDEGAVVLGVRRIGTGERRLLWVKPVEPGDPAPVVPRDIELHVHLLAERHEERAAAAADLDPASGFEQVVAAFVPH